VTDLPLWFEFVILSLASFRLWRIIGADVVFDRLRDRLTRRDRFEEDETLYRRAFDEWLHCAWCLGFWVAVAVFLAWLIWPVPTLWACLPFALSAVVGLIASNWD